MGKLIKFDHVNTHGNFPALLEHCGIDYEKRGSQLRALCPFHEDKNPSLSIALEATGDAKANTWHCFGCKQSGSIIDFAALWQGGDLRDGAALVAEVSGCGLAPSKASRKPSKGSAKPKRSVEKPTPAEKEAAPKPAINPPLKFTLPLDLEHPYVLERLTQAEAYTFGVGVCPETSKSMMAGRCCVPIHNIAGDLVAYAGRYLGQDPKEPKWLFPKGFEKRHVLFNAHRLFAGTTVVLVEGFFDALRLHGLGVPAVALMGTALADEQFAGLEALSVRRVIVLFDQDDEGQAAVPEVALRLARSFDTRIGALPVGDDPGSASEATLKSALRSLLV